jgi:hypothetical protein
MRGQAVLHLIHQAMGMMQVNLIISTLMQMMVGKKGNSGKLFS